MLFSKGLQISSELDTNNVYVGEPLRWSIEVEGHEKINYKFPNLDIDNDSVKIKQIVSSKNTNNKIEFEIISWEIGNFTTPNYSIEILDDNGAPDFTMIAPRQKYTILSILSTLDDENFRPLKGPVPVRNVLPIKNLILFFLIIFIVYAIITVWKTREKQKYNKIDYKYIENPKDRAFRRLEELSLSNFTKDFYTELSHIFREFIERKYYIRTLEMTTQEIKDSRSLFPMENFQFEELIIFLNLSDHVKYALQMPTKSEMELDKEKIKTIINNL
tara:strand:- start:58 stop:879 length:822 start_codon:yes stop_codon:yes gene_type:complete